MGVGATTFGAIITKAQQRADMVNSSFISDSEWEGMANATLQHLYEKLIEAYGADYLVQQSSDFTTDGVTDTLTLPTDFFKLLGVDIKVNAGQNAWRSVYRFNFADRNQYSIHGVVTVLGGSWTRYRLRGTKLWLTPLPAAGQTLRFWYAPLFTPLTLDADSFDGINGWEEWAVNDIAMKALAKEESDLSGVMALQQVQNDRLQSIIDNRDAGEPATVTDVYAMNDGVDDGEGYI
jgi:hypothetical protein